MRKVLMILLAMVVLGGCGVGSKVWIMKPGQTEEEYQTDRWECRTTAIDRTQPYIVIYPGSSGRNWKEVEKIFNQCMEEKGYRWEGKK
jgi:uncharacterized protein YceK